MAREGRLYYQYLKFLMREELPLPSTPRQLSSDVHGASAASWGDWKAREWNNVIKCKIGMGEKPGVFQSRAEGINGTDAAGKGTAMAGMLLFTLFTFPENFAPLLAREGKSRSRNCLGVEWSSLSRELMKRRILSTETRSVGTANAAELEEKHRETLLGNNPCLFPDTPAMFVHPHSSQSSLWEWIN